MWLYSGSLHIVAWQETRRLTDLLRKAAKRSNKACQSPIGNAKPLSDAPFRHGFLKKTALSRKMRSIVSKDTNRLPSFG